MQESMNAFRKIPTASKCLFLYFIGYAKLSYDVNFLSVILDCITSMNLVEICNMHGMHTPTIWILSVYEILKNLRFCSSIRNFLKFY